MNLNHVNITDFSYDFEGQHNYNGLVESILKLSSTFRMDSVSVNYRVWINYKKTLNDKNVALGIL